jgi:GTP-binding protein Era
MMQIQDPKNKSLMVSVLGKPNVGKSTLINYLIGFDLSIVSNKPQTTRNMFHCSFTIDKTEIILLDSPGVHKSGQELNVRMNGQAQFAAEGADLNLIVIDGSYRDPIGEFKDFYKTLDRNLSTSWLVINKCDLAKFDENRIYEQAKEILPALEKVFVISAETGDGVHLLTGALCDMAPFGPHLYPSGRVSNKNMRFFVCEYIREQAFRILKEELPYELAVTIESYEDVREPDSQLKAKISACILVNRVSQRAIVVGSKGSVIKEIGIKARKKIESMLEGRVVLNLHVKVSNKWFKNNFVLEELGLPRVQGSARVWRKR